MVCRAGTCRTESAWPISHWWFSPSTIGIIVAEVGRRRLSRGGTASSTVGQADGGKPLIRSPPAPS